MRVFLIVVLLFVGACVRGVRAEEVAAPETWQGRIARLQADNESRIATLDPGQRAVLDAKGAPILGADSLAKGQVGRLRELTFVGEIDDDKEFGSIAQFSCEGAAFFVAGVKLDGLVPGKTASYAGYWVITGFVPFTNRAGVKQRGAVIAKVDESPLAPILAQRLTIASIQRTLQEFPKKDGTIAVGVYKGISRPDGITESLYVETVIGRLSEIPLTRLTERTIAKLRETDDGRDIRLIEPEDRPFVVAGHKHRPREWTSGTHHVDASFVSIIGDKVTLMRADNGKTISISIATLSPPDQDFLKGKRWKEQKPLER